MNTLFWMGCIAVALAVIVFFITLYLRSRIRLDSFSGVLRDLAKYYPDDPANLDYHDALMALAIVIEAAVELSEDKAKSPQALAETVLQVTKLAMQELGDERFPLPPKVITREVELALQLREEWGRQENLSIVTLTRTANLILNVFFDPANPEQKALVELGTFVFNRALLLCSGDETVKSAEVKKQLIRFILLVRYYAEKHGEGQVSKTPEALAALRDVLVHCSLFLGEEG